MQRALNFVKRWSKAAINLRMACVCFFTRLLSYKNNFCLHCLSFPQFRQIVYSWYIDLDMHWTPMVDRLRFSNFFKKYYSSNSVRQSNWLLCWSKYYYVAVDVNLFLFLKKWIVFFPWWAAVGEIQVVIILSYLAKES